MKSSLSPLQRFASTFSRNPLRTTPRRLNADSICARCWRKQQVRFAHQPADDPNWMSVVDNPARLVKTGKRHGPGLIILGTLLGHIWIDTEETGINLMPILNSMEKYHVLMINLC